MDFEEIRKCQMDFGKWILRELGGKMDFVKVFARARSHHPRPRNPKTELLLLLFIFFVARADLQVPIKLF